MGEYPTEKTRRLQIDDNLPESEWCDVRIEYLKDGKTVAQIAEERGCETRAISRMIKGNRSFSDLGRKRTPYRMDGYQETVERLLKSGAFSDASQIMAITRKLLQHLRPLGYTGSERTLRDYLQTLPWPEWVKT